MLLFNPMSVLVFFLLLVKKLCRLQYPKVTRAFYRLTCEVILICVLHHLQKCNEFSVNCGFTALKRGEQIMWPVLKALTLTRTLDGMNTILRRVTWDCLHWNAVLWPFCTLFSSRITSCYMCDL